MLNHAPNGRSEIPLSILWQAPSSKNAMALLDSGAYTDEDLRELLKGLEQSSAVGMELMAYYAAVKARKVVSDVAADDLRLRPL